MNILRKYFSLVILIGVLLQYPITAVAACTADPWDSVTPYYRGDIVTYSNNEWRGH